MVYIKILVCRIFVRFWNLATHRKHIKRA